MKEIIVKDDAFAYGGFTSGGSGIWTRQQPDDPPVDDYIALGRRLGRELSDVVRPYQANGSRVAAVGREHGGSGVIKDNELKRVDGLVTAERGIVLSIIAADCVPVYLTEPVSGVIGLLHCGRQAAGDILRSGAEQMKALGACPQRIHMHIGPHICGDCYEVGEDVRAELAGNFSPAELKAVFSLRGDKLYLDLSKALKLRAAAEGITDDRITETRVCTFCDSSFYSYRRGDRGRQNLAFLMMK